ncbi:hypothetical protein ACJW30_03G044900 [Castanea mollissima]
MRMRMSRTPHSVSLTFNPLVDVSLQELALIQASLKWITYRSPYQEKTSSHLLLSLRKHGLPPLSTSVQPNQPLPTMFPHGQITRAALEKNNEGHFQVRVNLSVCGQPRSK